MQRTLTNPVQNENAAQQLANHYTAVRKMTETLCRPLSAEDQMIQSMPDTSPAKWHQAHTTWFFETFLLKPFLPGYQQFHPDFTFLYNSYYKQVKTGGHEAPHPVRAQRGLMSRPSLEQVRLYREYVDRHMLELLSRGGDAVLPARVTLGINHEQQHQELIVTDIKHGLWTNPLRPAYVTDEAPAQAGSAPSLEWHSFEEGLHAIGYEGDGFAFDNETPRHQVFLRAFHLASRMVTNAEYLEFMRDGGYVRPELWLSEGWDTVCAQKWNAPLYWEERDGNWLYYTVSGMRSVDPAVPVCHVSFYEADAFARWAGARLATEMEWEIAAASTPVEGTLLENSGLRPRAAAGQGLTQTFGDAWEWTASPYVAYPGFQPAAGALGEYNGKFMCNQMVLRGGSCATPKSHIRASYRNFFPAHARWQFSGIRLAK